MKKGFDTNRDLTKFAAALVSKGYDFVGRYYNINNPAKNLTLAEASILSTAGLGIVAVWENGFPTTASYFSHNKGVYDGTSAYHYASTEISQPGATPVYFTVDYDASDEDINGPVLDYFQGISDGFNTISHNQPAYNIGIYGSGAACSALLNSKIATYAWLAQSMGWRESRTFSDYNIKQSLGITECKELGGISGDPDASPNDNEGSFKINVA